MDSEGEVRTRARGWEGGRRSADRDPLIIRWILSLSIAAFCISVATSLLVLLFIIKHDRELAARDYEHISQLEKIKSDSDRIPHLEQELAAVKNWVIAVYERADARGWDLPTLPQEVRSERVKE